MAARGQNEDVSRFSVSTSNRRTRDADSDENDEKIVYNPAQTPRQVTRSAASDQYYRHPLGRGPREGRVLMHPRSERTGVFSTGIQHEFDSVDSGIRHCLALFESTLDALSETRARSPVALRDELGRFKLWMAGASIMSPRREQLNEPLNNLVLNHLSVIDGLLRKLSRSVDQHLIDNDLHHATNDSAVTKMVSDIAEQITWLETISRSSTPARRNFVSESISRGPSISGMVSQVTDAIPSTAIRNATSNSGRNFRLQTSMQSHFAADLSNNEPLTTRPPVRGSLDLPRVSRSSYLVDRLLNRQAASEDEDEPLPRDFQIQHKDFFAVGRVFKLVWHQSAGVRLDGSIEMSHVSSRGKFNEAIHTSLRWMLVVKSKPNFSICCPVSTYGKRGLNSAWPPNEVEAHAIVYDNRQSPQALAGEPKSSKRPIPIRVTNHAYGWRVDPACRVHFGKCHAVEHNVKVANIGVVVEQAISLITTYFRKEMLDD